MDINLIRSLVTVLSLLAFAGIVWFSAIVVLALLCLVLPPDGDRCAF